MLEEDVPERLYKYRSVGPNQLSWVKKTILEGELYMPAARELNDPFELRPVVSLESNEVQLEKHLREMFNRRNRWSPAQVDEVIAEQLAKRADHKQWEIETKKMTVVQHKNLTEKIGVYSMTSTPDDILMWSHYGDEHRGLCLEFDGTREFAQDAWSVAYVSMRPVLNPILDSISDSIEKSLLTKSDRWTYEKEWRFIREDGPGVKTSPPEFLVGMILGALVEECTVTEIKEWVKMRIQPLRIRQAVINARGYHIDLVDIAL